MLVEVLLRVSQICAAYPRVVTLYTDPVSFLRHSLLEVVISDVLSLSPPPPIVLTLDQSCHILQQQTLEVSRIPRYYNCVVARYPFYAGI